MTVLAILGGIAAACTILAFIATGMRMAWNAVKALVKISEAMPTLLEVAEQFKPNGGSSLVDAVHRLELGQRALLIDRGYPTLDAFLEAHGGGATASPASSVHIDNLNRASGFD